MLGSRPAVAGLEASSANSEMRIQILVCFEWGRGPVSLRRNWAQKQMWLMQELGTLIRSCGDGGLRGAWIPRMTDPTSLHELETNLATSAIPILMRMDATFVKLVTISLLEPF